MSNYKWVKMDEEYVELRKEDFELISFFKVNLNSMNSLLLDKLFENGVDTYIEGDGVSETQRYVLDVIDRKVVTITAPLYEFKLSTGTFELLEESYTDTAISPTQYEWVKETYLRCVEEVINEQAKIFEEEFMEKSLDGISSVVTISSNPDREPNYFYEQYIPEEYIKVCEKNCPFTRVKHDVVFIKKMDANEQVITIKVPDLYKGLVIGKSGENIKKIAKQINAKRINVI